MYICSFITSVLDGDEWSVSRASRFTPEKEFCSQLNGRLSGPQSCVYGLDRKKSLLLARNRTPEYPTRSLVTLLTTLSRLQFRVC
jgi:hypothetical protein